MVNAESPKGRDRRKYPRFEYPFFISYKKNGAELDKDLSKPSHTFYFTKKGEKQSVTHNVSVGGICFPTKEKLLRGTKLTLKIWSPTSHKPLLGLVKVIWQRKRPLRRGYLTGVGFISLDNKEELKKVLEMFTKLKLEETIEQ